jgi:carbohydrate kinase (thermoresistant glucokinase family)
MRPVIYIMGVSGSGKTTIGEMLSIKTGLPFFDADDFHPLTNKQKMKAGIALNDEDRKPWLANLHQLAVDQSAINGAIIACSALKEKYRQLLTTNVQQPFWIFLQGNYEIIHDRIEKRNGHFMPAQLLQSQFDSLEIPVDAFTADIQNEPEKIIDLILKYLHHSKAI